MTNNRLFISEEAYFGIDNPLVTRMSSQYSKMRSMCMDEKEKNSNVKNSELVKMLEKETHELEKIVEEEMNVEKCMFGYTGDYNLYSIGAIWNRELYTNYKKIKTNLNDVMETKQGYKFKNKKGIYFCVITSIKVLLDDSFTNDEITAITLHELGHCTSNIIEGMETYVLDNFTKRLLTNTFNVNESTKEKLLKEIDEARKNENDTNKMAEELINNMDSKSDSLMDFKKMSGKDLTKYLEEVTRRKMDDPKRIVYKTNPIFKFFIGVYKTIASFFIPLLIPIILNHNKKIKKLNNTSLFIKEEEVADNMAISYGMGTHLSSGLRKLSITGNFDKSNLITKIPFLDLYDSYIELEMDFYTALGGYPSNEQRVTNAYITCKYELENNKELTATQRKEIEEQMKKLSSIYDEYVFDKGRKGLLYKLFSKVCRKNIEDAAKANSSIKDRILDPLKKRSDLYYK